MTAGSIDSPVFDFTSLDFDGIESDLIRYAQSRFPSEVWTDLNESNELRRLIELMAYAADLLSYSQNAHTLETIVATLVREQNFRNIAKTYDYELASASPSTTTLSFVLDPGSLPLAIPSTFKVADSSGTIIFQPDVSGVAAATPYVVTATQGDEKVLEAIGVSDGTRNQRYTLASSPLIDDTETILVASTAYTKVVNFIEAAATDEVYRLDVFEDDTVQVVFGDGVNGKIPPIGSALEATYKIGGGDEGNLPVGTITNLVTTLSGVISVTNTVAATGGGAKQTLANAKRQLPLSIKANDRAVTTQDYATLAVELVAGLLKATAVTTFYAAGGAPVIIYGVPNGGGTVTPALANLIVSALRFGVSPTDTSKAMAGRRISVRTANYVNLVIDIDAYVNRGSTASVVQSVVEEFLTTRYSLSGVDFGTFLDLQDAYNTVDPNEAGIDGLSRVFYRRFTIEPNFSQYVGSPTTGTGAAEGITASRNSGRREWNVRMQIPGGSVPEFTVYERRLGTIFQINDTSLVDESGAFETSELVTSSSGYRLRVREQEQEETFTIASNTSDTITISGTSSPGGISGLLVLASPGDSYVVERQDAVLGKISRATLTAPAAASQPAITVDTIAGFTTGDKVLVRDSGSNSEVLEVLTAVGSTITFTTDLSFPLATNDTADWFWQSTDGYIGFAVVNGSTPFSVTDQFYVDVYPYAGDLFLRPYDFPILDASNLNVVAIGGVK